MTLRILLASPSLGLRKADIESVLGGSIVRPGEPADLIVFAGAVPDAAATALAGELGLPLAGLGPAPLAVAALDEMRRPLGYRVSAFGGYERAKAAEEETGRLAGRLERLAAVAAACPPGSIRIPETQELEALARDCVWLDPYDRLRIGLSEALAYAEDFAGFLLRDLASPVGLNITVGKRRHIEPFVAFPRRRITQFSRLVPAIAEAKRTGGRIVVWASWRHDRAERQCAAEGVPLARMEDGFLRSVGLGAAFVRSMSLVVDGRGIYYDPSRPSDLEHLLEHGEISDDSIRRARALREALVAANLTKYNVGAGGSLDRIVPAGATGVLVPGQVEDDASIMRGASAVRTNLGLIQAARARWPDAFLIYKPHPDVEAGYRVGRVPDEEALRYCDRIIRDRSIVDLFNECTAIETMTSLAGFEGLLRGLKVAAHGQPFYAGWGLTQDLSPPPRRTRRRSLDELVAATLLIYPRYVDPASGLPCGPEVVMRRLAAARARSGERGPRLAQRFQHGLALARHRVLGPLLRRLT